MNYITRREGIECEMCGHLCKEGESIWYLNRFYRCERCADEYLEGVKQDAELTVSDDYFDLEKEVNEL